jgi:hypothetical protein
LKNNDELLNRRLEQLKERDFNLKKKEFLLTKLKTNDFLDNNILKESNERELDKNFERKNNNNKLNSESKLNKILIKYRIHI